MPILLLEIPILEFLDKLHIRYERFEHPPVATVKEAEQYSELHPGAHCRNLFLRDKKGIQHFLVILKIETPINLAELAKQLKCGRLSFASDKRLYKYLGTQPGAVSPFGLMHDTGHEVKVILDNAILDSDKAGFHPNVNTATLVIAVLDLFHFLEMNGNSYQVVDFSKEVYL